MQRLEQLAKRVSAWQLAALPKRKLALWSFVWPVDGEQDWKLHQTETFPLPPIPMREKDFIPRDQVGKDFTPPDEVGKNFTLSDSTGQNPTASLAEVRSEPDPPEAGESDGDPEALNPATTENRQVPERIRQKPGNGKAGQPPKDRWELMAPFEGTNRLVQIKLSEPDVRFKTVTARVTYRLAEQEENEGRVRANPEGRGAPKPLEFTLDFYDFPLIDNIRIGDGQRLAILLNEFDNDHLKVTVVLFPGMYGSQRDKPFLDAVMQQLPKLVDSQ